LADLKFIYLSLIDDGDTQTLQDDVELAWTDDTWVMRDKLLNISPYVSAKVAYEMADKTTVFPHAVAFEVLVENPDLLKDTKFIKYLTTKADPMPDYLVNLLYLSRDESSFRTELLSQMNTARIAKAQAEDAIMKLYVSQGNHGAAYDMLETKDCSICDMLLAEEALESGDFVLADSYVSSLDSRKFIKDPVSTAEVAQYGRWYAIHKNVVQTGRTWEELTSAEVLELEDIALTYFFTTAGKKAMAVLSAVTDNGYFIPPAYDGGGFEFRAFLKEDEASQDFIQVYPNPATNIINVELEYTQSIKSPRKFQIKDALGRLIYEEDILSKEQVFSINSTNWAQGTYIYSLMSKDEILKTGKLEVIH
jgi:hypothetical protein